MKKKVDRMSIWNRINLIRAMIKSVVQLRIVYKSMLLSHLEIITVMGFRMGKVWSQKGLIVRSSCLAREILAIMIQPVIFQLSLVNIFKNIGLLFRKYRPLKELCRKCPLSANLSLNPLLVLKSKKNQQKLLSNQRAIYASSSANITQRNISF